MQLTKRHLLYIASSVVCFLILSGIIALVLHFTLHSHSDKLHKPQVHGCFKRIFSFGDSLSDTGNHLYRTGNNPDFVGFPPFGETYFGKPTGRASNGRLIIDFIAQAFKLPLLPPSLPGSTTEYFHTGANFGMFGATVLDKTYSEEPGEPSMTTWDYPLWLQVETFKKLLPLISHGSDIGTVMNSSLFIVGEIGGNDYNRALIGGSVSREIVRSWVLNVVLGIYNALQELIVAGAKTLVVPGLLPLGCSPAYLSMFQSSDPTNYDSNRCLKWANELSQFHNELLKIQLQELRRTHPGVSIIYANYYASQMSVLEHAERLGFSSTLSACCGGQAPYNFALDMQCGSKNATLCTDPSKYVSWDGVHPTEAVNQIIADGVINGPYAYPIPISNYCG